MYKTSPSTSNGSTADTPGTATTQAGTAKTPPRAFGKRPLVQGTLGENRKKFQGIVTAIPLPRALSERAHSTVFWELNGFRIVCAKLIPPSTMFLKSYSRFSP